MRTIWKFIRRYAITIWLTICMFLAAAGPLYATAVSKAERQRADHVILLQIRRQCERQNIRIRGSRGLWKSVAQLANDPAITATVNKRVDRYLQLHNCKAITLEDSSGILSKTPPR